MEVKNLNDLNEKLLESAIRGNLEEMKECLKNGADVNYQESIEGRTALIYACRNNENREYQTKMIQTLIEHGADVNQCDKYKTPLLYATIEDKVNFEAIKLLVENGADVNKELQVGTTALSWCVMTKSNEKLELMKYLISKGADINHKDDFGETPLIIATKYNNIQAIKTLIANGADLNLKDNNGKTALMITTLMIKNNGNKQDRDEYTAIQSLVKGHTGLEKAISKSKAKDRAKIKSKSKSNDCEMGI